MLLFLGYAQTIWVENSKFGSFIQQIRMLAKKVYIVMNGSKIQQRCVGK